MDREAGDALKRCVYMEVRCKRDRRRRRRELNGADVEALGVHQSVDLSATSSIERRNEKVEVVLVNASSCSARWRGKERRVQRWRWGVTSVIMELCSG